LTVSPEYSYLIPRKHRFEREQSNRRVDTEMKAQKDKKQERRLQ